MTKEEALKELRNFIGQLTEGCQDVIKVLIPELVESEDERIREWLIDTIKAVPNDSIEWDVIDKSHVLTWLEKQKEQKPVEWSEEDKHRCKGAIYFLETAKKHYASTSEIELTIEWLKSLQPQVKQE